MSGRYQEGYANGHRKGLADAQTEIDRLRAELRDILGEKTMSEILWRDQPDDEMVTITLKLGRYRKAQSALGDD
jgi:hypothetical protein